MGDKGFFASLFDLSFSEFITTKLVKVMYVVSLLGSAWISLRFLTDQLNQDDGGSTFWGFVGAPVIFLFFVISSRVWLEIVVVVFRIADFSGQTADSSRESAGLLVEVRDLLRSAPAARVAETQAVTSKVGPTNKDTQRATFPTWIAWLASSITARVKSALETHIMSMTEKSS